MTIGGRDSEVITSSIRLFIKETEPGINNEKYNICVFLEI